MISIYLSNTEIQIVQGSSGFPVKIEKVFRHALAEGCLMNGIVTNEEMLKRELAGIWEDHKIPKEHVVLTVNSSQILNRPMQIPALKRSEMAAIIGRNFQDAARGEDIYDCFPLRGMENGTLEVLAAAMDKEHLASLRRVFGAVGIRLEAVCPGQSAALHLLRAMKVFAGKTGVAVFFDGDSIWSFLFENGEYSYSSMTRVFSQSGTPERQQDIFRVVSTTRQFQTGRRNDYSMEEVLFLNLPKEDEEALITLRESLGLAVSQAAQPAFLVGETKEPVLNFLFPVGSLVRQKQRIGRKKAKDHPIDFIEALRFEPDRVKQKRRKQRLAAAAVILVLIAAAAEGILLGRTFAARSRADELEAYLNSTAVTEKQEEIETLESETARYAAQAEDIENVDSTISSYPLVSEEVLETLERESADLADIEVTGYQAQTGELSFNVYVPVVTDAEQYIRILQELELFELVYYTGYDLSTEGYNVHVVCLLNEYAGK